MVDPRETTPDELDDAQLESASGAGIPVSGVAPASASSMEALPRDGDGSQEGTDPRVKDVHDPDPWKNKPT